VNLDKFDFTRHALDEIKDRRIKHRWIEDTLHNPDRTKREYARRDGRRCVVKVAYLKRIAEFNNHWLKVVVDPTVHPNKVITVFFDSNLD
jgi:hypothetical protein